MRIYAGFTLSECACIMSGLGAYPASSKPRPGQGPTKPEELSEEGAYSSVNWEVNRGNYLTPVITFLYNRLFTILTSGGATLCRA